MVGDVTLTAAEVVGVDAALYRAARYIEAVRTQYGAHGPDLTDACRAALATLAAARSRAPADAGAGETDPGLIAFQEEVQRCVRGLASLKSPAERIRMDEQAARARYDEAIASGLSDAEAREDGWPAPRKPEPAGETCPACKGKRGSVVLVGDSEGEEWVACEACGGTGKPAPAPAVAPPSYAERTGSPGFDVEQEAAEVMRQAAAETGGPPVALRYVPLFRRLTTLALTRAFAAGRASAPGAAAGDVGAVPTHGPGAHVAVILYTNHRGEQSRRRIVPHTVRWGRTEWHPDVQWLLDAFDLDKQAERTFALKDIHAWGAANVTAAEIRRRLAGGAK